VGAIGALGSFDKWGGIWTISILLVIAGVLGDAVNYHVGKAIGPRIFRGETNTGFIGRYLNRKHLERAHAFFEKYGGKAVILGRFVPIVRTFVPFVAGAGAMNYSKFALFNITGAILWIGICVAAGYFFGNIEVVKKNFEIVVIGIVIVSVLPVVIEFVIARRKHKAALASQNQ
jgi:membrane-associated protein